MSWAVSQLTGRGSQSELHALPHRFRKSLVGIGRKAAGAAAGALKTDRVVRRTASWTLVQPDDVAAGASSDEGKPSALAALRRPKVKRIESQVMPKTVRYTATADDSAERCVLTPSTSFRGAERALMAHYCSAALREDTACQSVSSGSSIPCSLGTAKCIMEWYAVCHSPLRGRRRLCSLLLRSHRTHFQVLKVYAITPGSLASSPEPCGSVSSPDRPASVAAAAQEEEYVSRDRLREASSFVPRFLCSHSNPRSVVPEDLVQKLMPDLPLKFREKDLILVYSTLQHGVSMATMYRMCHEMGPVLVFVEDNKGALFGAFASETLRMRGSRYYGTGETFVFRLRPKFSVHRWSRKNNFFLFCKDKAFGVGGGPNFAFYCHDNFEAGSSGMCRTFDSPVLASDDHFQPYAVEVWAFYIPRFIVHEAFIRDYETTERVPAVADVCVPAIRDSEEDGRKQSVGVTSASSAVKPPSLPPPGKGKQPES